MVGSDFTLRVKQLEKLLGMLEPCPEAWIVNGSKSKEESVGCVNCDSYKQLTLGWRKAMKWTDGLDHALSVMLASVASTKAVGDQLWVKIIGPAACGKSTLCEALNTAQEYIVSKDTFTGLSSGYQSDDAGAENLSLVNRLKDKTLIINDGDTLLQLPNLPQVISQLRAFYGRNLRTSYKNKMSANHEGYNTTILLCGTSSLRKLDQSELGERFLDCVIMEGIDDDLEDNILWRVANRSERNVGIESNGNPETQYDPELAAAMQLTGGYVNHLREIASDELPMIGMDHTMKMHCVHLGKFVSHMRARPSTHQDETAERELGARLVSQHVRLAKCLALVLNYKEVNTEVMKRVRRVALDTSRGQTLNIVHAMYKAGTGGMVPSSVGLKINLTETKVRALLRFLKQIHVVEQFQPKGNKLRWRLTQRMVRLYCDVVGIDD